MTELVWQRPDTPMAVWGDATHLHQITMNLCRNAAEAMAGQPGRITLTIGPAAPPTDTDPSHKEWLRLRVSDTGPGMNPQTLAHLFEPFFTTKPLGKGSGLGLAVVLGLVEDMGGRVDVESTPGQGSVFEIVLPAAPATATLEQVAQDPLPRGNERILLVDDEAEVAGTFRRQLLRLGYRVEAFTAPLLALERFRLAPDRYDLVITDMVMPDLNGQDLAKAIRKMRADVPVIFCSAYRPDQIILSGVAPKLLHKPVDPSDFARQVRTSLDRTSQ